MRLCWSEYLAGSTDLVAKFIFRICFPSHLYKGGHCKIDYDHCPVVEGLRRRNKHLSNVYVSPRKRTEH